MPVTERRDRPQAGSHQFHNGTMRDKVCSNHRHFQSVIPTIAGMRMSNICSLAVIGFGLCILSSASDCVPFQQASQHVGEDKCVMGKVVRVKASRGAHFLDFCEEQMACPFTVVVFSHDLKDVGDVRRLAGRMIEIHGAVKLYGGRAEIILSRVSQVTGGAALLPPLPKDYDVENRGHYSAGHLSSKKLKPAKRSPNATATYSYDVEGDEPPD